MALDLAAIRAQFPILSEQIGGKPLAYLDSAATSQKPLAVLDAVRDFYLHANANVHRSQHALSEKATVAFEQARETVRAFVHARSIKEVIVTKGATEAINLVARSFGSSLTPKDAILLSRLEHHSNVIPWLQIAKERGASVRWIELGADGQPKMEQLESELQKGDVRLIAVTGQSNVLGVRPQLKKIADMAHAVEAYVVVDAAQLVAHGDIDVQAFDCDFLAFSSHKLYGPGGVGVLWGREELLEMLPPFLGGGMMIDEVQDDDFTAAPLPAKFEAGTPPAAEFVGLAAAIKWLQGFPLKDRELHERALIAKTIEVLRSCSGVSILGPADATKAFTCVSFLVDDVHAHDVAQVLGQEGLCVRAGHHCAQPLHRSLGVDASVRASFGIYNTLEELDRLAPAIDKARSLFARS